MDSTFRVVQKPVLFVWRETGGNQAFVGTGNSFYIRGEVDCNYEITSLHILFTRDGTTVKDYAVAKDPDKTILFLEEFEAGALGEGIYTVSISATANGYTETVHSFRMGVGTLPEVTDTLRQEIAGFLNDRSRYSFEDMEDYLTDRERRAGGLEYICMKWSDLGGRGRQDIFDFITGSTTSSYQVQLFELDIADMIREMLNKPDLPEVSLPKWFKTLKNATGTLKAGESITKANMEELLESLENEMKMDSDPFLEQMYNISSLELEHISRFISVLKSVNNLNKTVKWSDTILKTLAELFEDHYQDLAVLKTINSGTEVRNAAFRQALNNVITNYETKYGAGLERILDALEEWAVDKMIESVEEAAIEIVFGEVNPYVKLIKVANEYLSACAGVTGYGKAWTDFVTAYTVQRATASAYYNAVTATRQAFEDNGNATDEQIAELQMLFRAMRTATARAMDKVAECESDESFKPTYVQFAAEIRARTMPGVN